MRPGFQTSMNRIEVLLPRLRDQNDSRNWLLMPLSDVGVNLRVIPAGIFFLSFSKWYVVSDTADSGISPWVFFSHLDRHTHWSNPNATRPIKLDMPCMNVLLSLLYGISWIPSWIGGNATHSDEHDAQNA